jgi:hypothetical protein
MSKKQTKKVEVSYLRIVTELHPSIVSLGSLTISSVDAVLCIAKNRKIFEEKLKIYEEARKKIAEANCDKDKNGKPLVENNNYVYSNDDAKKETNNLLTELLGKEIKMDLHLIKEEWLDGVDGLTGNTIAGLLDILE